MLDVLLDAFLDSLKVLAVSLVLYILLSFVEDKISSLFTKHKKVSPIIGSSIGLIPQCGISVVAADLYIKRSISMGCLFAVFFSCSDEAFPILLSNKSTALYVVALIILKFICGFVIGYTIDLVRGKREYQQATEVDSHIGCCHHHIEHEESAIKEHLIHPIVHSLKIFAYVFIINIIFGFLIYFIGEDNIINFLTQQKYLTPLVCALVGLIPNCASSVLLSELFILNTIPFAALFSGLCINAGLGLVFLIKNKNVIKDTLIIIALLLVSSIGLGYIILAIQSIF